MEELGGIESFLKIVQRWEIVTYFSLFPEEQKFNLC